MPVRALIALLLLLWSPAAFAQSAPWRMTEAAGQVEVRRGAQLVAARRGAVVAPGDLVSTGANGRAVLVRGRDFVIVSPRTQLRVPGTQEEQGGLVRMMQTSGSAQYRIERRANPHFGVRTPHLVALVKGTVFTVDVSEDGATVAVTEGRVEVATLSGEMRQMVEPGFVAGVLAADPDRLTHGRSADTRAESSANRGASNRGGTSADHRRDGRNRERGDRPRLAYGELGSGNRELAGDNGQDRRAREARRSFDEVVRIHESNAGGNGNAGGDAGNGNGNGGSGAPDPGGPSTDPGQGQAQPGGSGASGPNPGSGSSGSSSGPQSGSPAATAPAIDPVTAPVTAPVTEAVAPVTAPVVEAVAPVTAPVIEAAAPVTAPVIEAVAPVTAPVIEAAAPVTAPVIEAVAPVTAPVIETVVAPVLAPVLAPVTATVPPTAPSSPATNPTRCLLGLVCL